MKATIENSILVYFWFSVLLITQTAYGQLLYNASAFITPPVGNSPKMVVKTASSYLVFTCVQGVWIRGKGSATLLDATNNKVVGNYTTIVDYKGELGTWTLLNSIGDGAESGYSASTVTGRLVASSLQGTPGSLPEQLIEAASHDVNDGEASTVSYIQKHNVKGGLPPRKKKTCLGQNSVATVPFTAEFRLWTQDTLPASVPEHLVAPGGAVEGLFGKGYITYVYNGSGWVDSARVATLYTIPGTPALGELATNGVECWDIWNPNGMVLDGLRISPKLIVEPNACPWTLSKVTSASGPLTSIGVFSHVQTISTRWGVAPALSYNNQPALGATWTVPFSAIFWLYVST